jgi:hypothetical protein
MSPEQACARPIDRRTDIWAFGCILFEVLTGTRAFRGETVTEILAAVLEREPDWQALPRSTLPAVERLVRRCLEKDVKQRLRDMGDVRLELEDLLAGRLEGNARQPRGVTRRTALGALLGAAAGAAGTGVFAFRRNTVATPRPLTRFAIPLPEGFRFNASFNKRVAISPDATWLACAVVGPGESAITSRELTVVLDWADEVQQRSTSA